MIRAMSALGRWAVPITLFSVFALAVPRPADAHMACSRIGVETRDGRVLVSYYVVNELDWVNRMHRLIDQNGDTGSWTVPAGDLGLADYTVTYTCL